LRKNLAECGLRADYIHAGLDSKSRSSASDSMRSGSISVLVATSMLEMAVNFPARKVIVYDGFSFEGIHSNVFPSAVICNLPAGPDDPASIHMASQCFLPRNGMLTRNIY